MSKKSGKKDTKHHKPPIIVVDDLISSQYSTPTIIEECGKKQHERLLEILMDFFNPNRDSRFLVVDTKPRIEYSVKIDDEWRTLVLKPDAYLLLDTGIGAVNVIVEVTTRHPSLIPVEWLTAYALGYYITNLRPTAVLLVTPEEVRLMLLSTKLMEKLETRLKTSPRKSPDSKLENSKTKSAKLKDYWKKDDPY